jgi:hypothetical protein
LPPSENRETITARQQETHADNKQAFSGTTSYHIYQGPVATGSIFLFGMSYGLMWVLYRRLWPLVIGHALDNIAIQLFGWY